MAKTAYGQIGISKKVALYAIGDKSLVYGKNLQNLEPKINSLEASTPKR